MPSPKVLTAPPFIMLYYGAVIFAVQDVWQFADFFWVDVVGAVVAFGGFFIIGWSHSMFRAAKTTVNPFKVKETSSMVTGGPFAFSRNPMYLGMVIILLGWTIFTGTAVGFALTALFGFFIDRAQIQREEKALADIFGDEFEAYRQRVRRWI